jgi:hypothetical protein
MSKEEFKEFIQTKPELADYVSNGEMTWQKFYELYDLYGEDENIWSKYPKKTQTKITDFLEKINIDNIEEKIETAEKALTFLSEFSTKNSDKIEQIIKPISKTPISKFFGD